MKKQRSISKRILVLLAVSMLAMGSASAQARIKKIAEKAVQKVDNAAHKAADAIVDTSHRVADKTVDAKDRVADKTVNAKDRVVDKAVDVKDRVADKTVDVKDRVVDKTLDAKDKVVDTSRRVGEKVEDASLRAAERTVEATKRATQRLEDKVDDIKARRNSDEYPECLAPDSQSVDYWTFDVEESTIPTPVFRTYADALKGWPALPTAAQLRDKEAMRQYYVALKAFNKGLIQMATNRTAAGKSGASGVSRAEEYSDIADKIQPLVARMNSLDGPASELQNERKAIILDWMKSEECARVKSMEDELAKRAFEYDKAHPTDGAHNEYPFWAEERAKQNEVINAYNAKVAVRWHAAVQQALAAGEPDFKLVAGQDERLERLGWSTEAEKTQYTSLSSMINGAGMTLRVSCFCVPMQLFAVPFIHNTSVERNYQ